MDKRRTINFIAATLIGVGIWLGLQWYFRTYQPAPVATTPTPGVTTGAATEPSAAPVASGTPTTGTATTNSSTTAPSMASTQRTPDAPGVVINDSTQTAPTALGNPAQNAADYAIQLRVSPIGAGLDGITLNSFHRSEDFKRPRAERRVYEFQSPYEGPQLAYTRPGATRSVTINGVAIDLSSALWERQGPATPVTRQVNVPGEAAPVTLKGQAVTYALVVGLPDAQGFRQPVLKLTKTYTIFEQSNVTHGYEVWIDNAYENVSDNFPTLAVSSQINGPALPPRETNSSPDRSVFAGFVTPDGKAVKVVHVTPDQFKEAEPTINIQDKGPEADKNGKAVMTWAGTAGLYFNAFVLAVDPKTITGMSAEQKQIAEFKHAEDRPIVTTFQTATLTLGPKGAPPVEVDLRAYFGPRWRHVLDTPYYASLPRGFDHTLVVTSGPCGWCAFDWLINGMVWLLNVLHWVAGGFVGRGDWGIAIILLVAIVRSLLHPITKRSQVQMMEMGKMGPELAKLKAKYGDDKEGFSRAQMQLMKSQGFAPILGCLPMFLQMPIWIALWQALQSTFELRQAPFLWGFTWIEDLSKPDYLIKFGHDIPLLLGLHLDGINLLPLLLAVVFHMQARIQNSLSVATTPEQATQKKMMMWMSTFLFPLFLYNGPSGLNLYILTSTMVGMVESKIVRDHIKQRDAAKAAAPVIIDAEPARVSKKGNRDVVAAAPVKQGGIRGMIARMQQRVEDLQREQEKRKK